MLKLELDLKTLENLIGGNTPFQLEIKEGIIQTFARKHLKPLINDNAFRSLKHELLEDVKKIKEALCDELFQHIPVKKRDSNYYKHSWYVDKQDARYQELKAALENEARVLCEKVTRESLRELRTWAKEHIQKKQDILQAFIEEEVKRQLDATFEKRVRIEIHKRVKALYNAEEQTNV